MKTLEIEKATGPLAEYARRVGEDPVVLTEDGKPVAALVAVRNADLETLTLSTRAQFISLIKRSRERHNREGGISGSEMRRRLNLRKTARRK